MAKAVQDDGYSSSISPQERTFRPKSFGGGGGIPMASAQIFGSTPTTEHANWRGRRERSWSFIEDLAYLDLGVYMLLLFCGFPVFAVH